MHTTTSSSTKPVVVVLDPGHDNVHGGATSTIGGVTYREEQLTLKIALYCRDELQKYAGVRVYMTRTTADCPHPGTTSGNDNLARVHDAAALGADYYVSIHLNSATASAKGVEIYYPNANYATLASGNEAVDEDENVSADGKALSQAILNQLVKLGLSNRGVKVNTASATYPDGSKNDAYQVIRESKLYGFPGIIVEHCFITNPTEVGKFLSTDAQLRTLGEADALGIATYLGLKKGGSTDSDTLKITLPEGYGEEVVYLDGVACYGTVTGGVFSSTPDAEDARTAVMYRYNDQGVPAGMYVWSLTTTNGKYTATPVPELEDLLLYHGFSIRITGDSGIRCKTSVSDALKQQLTGKGVNGYTLKSYGTLILPKSLAKYTPLVLGADKVNVATAYDKASGLDNVFETKDGRDRFTAVLTKIPANQYKTELSFRGYITLTKDGQDVTIYGPIVQRSIYALAKTILESNTYPSGSATDTFLKKLISDADAQS
ncbi:MAG: N-acetylmuramoyl-L-alanine amidase [Oscillospiraceae bacterium]|nr:N-acetylmuramoyl-L-alanine amidase [Oscillospiraceae bacterium]